MKEKVQFVFEFEGRKPNEIAKINRELFGYIDHSHHGKYVYRRNGLLSSFAIERIAKGVFLTDLTNEEEIYKILKNMGTKKIRRFYFTINKIVP